MISPKRYSPSSDSEAASGRVSGDETQPKAVAHRSDCAVHNAPAFEPGPCNCGAIKGER